MYGRQIRADLLEYYKKIAGSIWNAMNAKIIYTRFSPRNILNHKVLHHILRADYESSAIPVHQYNLRQNELNLFSKQAVCLITNKEMIPFTELLFKIFTFTVLIFSFGIFCNADSFTRLFDENKLLQRWNGFGTSYSGILYVSNYT